jgi:hypothetical protein
MAENMPRYPASLSIDYAEQSDKLKVFFRLLLAIPILIILGMLAGSQHYSEGTRTAAKDVVTVGFVVGPTILMLLFRGKYPKWWYDWNLALTRFSTRVAAYVLLLRDEYPSTDEEQAVHIEVPYPDAAKELSRGLPLIKWLLALPHLIILYFLWIGVLVLTVVVWVLILVNGRYPRDLFDFVVGVMRWSLRVSAYATLLTTDVYPPFSLQA